MPGVGGSVELRNSYGDLMIGVSDNGCSATYLGILNQFILRGGYDTVDDNDTLSTNQPMYYLQGNGMPVTLAMPALQYGNLGLNDSLVLISTGSNWVELSRSDN